MIRKILILMMIGISSVAYSNNISVSSVSLSGQNTTSHYSLINFSVTWNNSWRSSVGTMNWDAAWIFAKYRVKTSTDWKHATLNWVNGTGAADGHTVPAGAVISSSNDNGAGGSYGVFIYASTASGSNTPMQTANYTGGKLRWNYGADGLTDQDSVEICVYAIEMVYIPQGSFYLGDISSSGRFQVYPAGTPYQVTSQTNPINLGTGTGYLYGTGGGVPSGAGCEDDFVYANKVLPADFPKGYSAFYMMKYEISQEQYVDFLNKLTRTQQTNRFSSTTVGTFLAYYATAYTPYKRNGVKLMSDPGGSSARVFGCDLNDNDVAGEAADGQNIACSFLSSTDFLAYLDWSGLRPMTEFEYEKACRGTLSAVAGEFAWGSASITNATGITNSGANNEIPSNSGSNFVDIGYLGAYRVGCFAQAATNRITAGASYYGVMELTGNVGEQLVNIGNVAGRSYTGLHGNGTINANGEADVNYWPGINGNTSRTTANGVYGGTVGCTGDQAGLTYKATYWTFNKTVSDRYYCGTGYTGMVIRSEDRGGRGVRTAP